MDDSVEAQVIEEWVEQCQQGKTRVYASVVQAMQQKVLGFLYRMTQNREWAEDLGQEVFLRAFQRLGQYDRKKGAFSTWLFTLARNMCLDELRKNHLIRVPLENAAELSTSNNPRQAYQEKAVEQRLAEAVGRLEPEYREVILLKEYEELSLEEIAYITGAPVGTVKSRLHRARLILQNQLADVLMD